MRILELSHGGRVDEVDMAGHQFMKRLLGLLPGIGIQQFEVIPRGHALTVNTRREANGTRPGEFRQKSAATTLAILLEMRPYGKGCS
jgi:hypothetical protein